MTHYQKQVVTQLLKQAGYKEQEKWWENNDIKSAIMKAELFADDPPFRPSLDIDKVVDEDCAKTCYHILKEHYENMDGKFMDWDKLKELLNQQPSSQSPEHKSDREPGGGRAK